MSTLAVNTITDANGGNTATINTYTPTESNMMGKNRIINGDMRIDQRNAGASVTPSVLFNTYTLDRWNAEYSAASKYSVQQTTTAPNGFVNSLIITSTAATSLTTTDYYVLDQFIEGTNTADLAWGTANAKTVTLSFWVRSSLTGTFGGAITNSAANRSYPFSYTISSANTWEQKSVTIPGDTSGTWLTTTGIGMRVQFGLGVGTTYSGTAGAWAGSYFFSATGATSVVGTNGATFYITGVQLEVGSVATPFERRPYGTELSLCQRYYYKLQAAGASSLFCSGRNQSTTLALGGVPFPVTMRINPTALEQSGTATDYQVRHLATSTTCSDVPTLGSTSPLGYVIFTVASGLTAGQACDLRAVNSNAYLAWSAEL